MGEMHESCHHITEDAVRLEGHRTVSGPPGSPHPENLLG